MLGKTIAATLSFAVCGLGKRNTHGYKHQQHLRRLDEELPASLREPIPHIIMFTHEDNLLRDDENIPDNMNEVQQNVLKTVKAYRDAWVEPDAEVLFLDNYSCLYRVEQIAPDLVPYFESEQRPQHKADICRIAALYQHGGYFFDTEVQVLQEVRPKPGISFVVSVGCNGQCFVPAFIASAPQHPMAQETLKRLTALYRDGSAAKSEERLLPIVLFDAYKQLSEDSKSTIFTLARLDLGYDPHLTTPPEIYPDLERQYGQGDCNIVLHDADAQKAYFYENMIDSEKCKRGVIPKQIWFIVSEEDLKARKDGSYENALNTIREYRTFWNDHDAPATFLDNQSCKDIIMTAFPTLAVAFARETNDEYKQAICRISALYLHGGYFFSPDAYVVDKVKPLDRTTIYFSWLGLDFNLFSQSFIAAAPEHKLFLGALHLLRHYHGKHVESKKGATTIMATVYSKLKHREKVHKTEYLEEITLDQELQIYPEVNRQAGGDSCNKVLYDPDFDRVFFYDRFCGPVLHESQGDITNQPKTN